MKVDIIWYIENKLYVLGHETIVDIIWYIENKLYILRHETTVNYLLP